MEEAYSAAQAEYTYVATDPVSARGGADTAVVVVYLEVVVTGEEELSRRELGGELRVLSGIQAYIYIEHI